MKLKFTLALLFLYVVSIQNANAQVQLQGNTEYGQLFDITYSTSQEDVLYAHTVTNHVVTSTDGGDTWDILYSDPLEEYATIKNLELLDDGTTLTFNVRSEGTNYNAIVLFDLTTETVTKSYNPPNSFEVDILIESYDVLDSNTDVVLMHTTYSLGGSYTHEVFYTNDGGTSWNSVYYSPVNDDVSVNNVAIAPNQADKIFIMRGVSPTRTVGGLLVSTNAGANWVEKIPGNTYNPIAFNPDNQDDILLGTFYPDENHVQNLYRSQDGGETWNIVPLDWTMMSYGNMNDIEFNPNNTDQIIVLEENEIAVSTDNGATWDNFVYNTIDPQSYYNGLKVSFNPFTNDEVAISTNFFPFISEDIGETLTKLDNPFINSTGTISAFTSEEANHVYYGLRSGYIHKDLQENTENGYALQALDQTFGSPLKVYADPVVEGRVFTNNRVINTSYISVSNEHGANSQLALSSMFFLLLEDVSTSVTNPNISWLSTGIEIHKLDLTDLENIVDENIAVPQLGQVIEAIQVDRENGDTVWMSQSINFYMTTDGGATWELSNTGLEDLTEGDDLILDIEQNPLNPDQLMLATTQGVYLSNDKGSTWSLILSEFTNRVAFSTITENAIVATTHYSDGFNVPLPVAKATINFSKDSGETWETISPEMLDYPVTETSAFTFSENEADVYFGVLDLGLIKYTIDLTTLSVSSEFVNNNPIVLYPNPVSETISIDTREQVEAVTIYNIAGQRVLNVSNYNQPIRVSALQAGIYVVRVETANGVYTQRISKK